MKQRVQRGCSGGDGDARVGSRALRVRALAERRVGDPQVPAERAVDEGLAADDPQHERQQARRQRRDQPLDAQREAEAARVPRAERRVLAQGRVRGPPAGPACHTGERSCFFTGDLEPPAPHEALPALERTLRARAAERPEGSYTVTLLDDPPLIGEKVQEEAEEVARAAREETDERVDSEAADVLYHLTVLLHSRGRGLADAEQVLTERRR